VVNDSPEEARAYFGRNALPYPCACDPDHDVYDAYGVASKLASLGQRPGLFIVDAEGIVRYAHIGRQQWEIPDNEDVLEVCRSIPCGVTP